MRNTDGCTWIIPFNSLYARKNFASLVSRNQFYSLRKRKTWRPDSTTAKFFARNCLCEIRMVGHEWFYWILSLFSPSQWVELNSTHWRSEFFAREERIQWNYSCATIRISHKQFLAKYFAVVESGLERIEKNQSCPTIHILHKQLLAMNFAGVESGLNNTSSWS